MRGNVVGWDERLLQLLRSLTVAAPLPETVVAAALALHLLLTHAMMTRFACVLWIAPILAAAEPQTSNNIAPITGSERMKWVAVSTVGPTSLAGGLFSAGFGTAINSPSEYGPTWEGFGKRYGMRLTGVATSNVMEAGIGSLWGEDPRYLRAAEGPIGRRLGHAVKMTFLAPNKNGGTRPAYARYIGISGNNYLSNAWRADSEATVGDATFRVAIGFLGRAGSNIFAEFWPDIRGRLKRNR